MKKCYNIKTWEDITDRIMISPKKDCINLAIKQSTPTDPVLAKFCELTGAKMYGDYVMFDVDSCNLFQEYSKHLRNEESKFEEIKPLLNL